MSEVAPEPRPLGENIKPKEFLADNMAVALHTRLILGNGALDPDKNVPEVTAEQLKSEHQKTREDTLNKISASSTVTRIEYWANQQGTFDDKMKIWTAKIISAYKNPNVNPAVLADTFTRLSLEGVNDKIVLSNLDEVNAQKLFQRYFAENTFQVTVRRENGDFVTIPSNVIRFIDDVAASYNGKYDQLQADLPSIQWVAAMFGDIDDELIAQMIIAEAKEQNEVKVQELAQNANTEDRKNKVNSEERRLLEHLNVKASKVTYPSVTGIEAGGPGPTPTPPPKPTPGKPEPEINFPIRQPPPPEPTIITKEKPKLFYKHLRKTPDQLRVFPSADIPTVETHAKLIALDEYQTRVGDRTKSESQMSRQEKEEFNKRTQQLIDQINQENKEINEYRSKINLDEKRFKQMFNELTVDLRNYMKETYNISLPETLDSLESLVLSPTLAKFYNPRQVAIAFFDPVKPIVYIDWERFKMDAKTIGKTMGDVTFEDFKEIFKNHLNKTNAHELMHFYSEISYWYLLETDKKKFDELTADEKKRAEVLPGRTGLQFLKPRLTPEGNLIRYQNNNALAWKERGRYLMEAVTEKLAQDYMKSVDPKFSGGTYVSEIKVLETIMENTGVSFSEFVKGYFGRHDLLPLAEKLSGKRVDDKGIHFDRKHYLEIATALMEYEANIARGQNTRSNYDLTISYLDNALNPSQKQEMKNFLSNTPDYIQLPQATKDYMASNLGIVLEKPKPVVSELPLTLEMAKKGVVDFEKVVKKLPADMQKIILNDPLFKNSFVGTSPTVGEYDGNLDHLHDPQFKLLQDALVAEAPNIRIVNQGRPSLLKKNVRSMINLDAAAQIIGKYKDQFPTEAQTDPKKWILDHPEQWCHQNPNMDKKESDKVEVRFGLLSGFPPESAKLYRSFIRARDKFEKLAFLALTNEDTEFCKEYLRDTNKIPYSDENRKKMQAIVDKIGKIITEDEKKWLVERRFKPRGKGTEALSAFSQADLEYADKLEELYAQSGMENAITKLKTELKI